MKINDLKKELKKVGMYIFTFFFGYLVIGFFLNSNYPTYQYSFNLIKAYEVLRDGLTLSAYFLAPAVAFVLFNDWREQHNKSVKNDFALKVFNQFESLEKEIHNAGMIWIEMDHLVPDKFKNKLNLEYRPIYINDKLFKENEVLILSFFKKINDIQEEFNIFLDKLRYWGIVEKKQKEIFVIANSLLIRFGEVSAKNEDEESYSEYIQFLEITSSKVNQYNEFLNEISSIVIADLLMQLQEN
ncbi:hypothetical protein DJ533_11885 [Acinetobacter defluvii]|uniref:Uncharacterized protein n=1 Tax=Acinetobacter defluvii TaxID=1871111 RepID=A0A2S2FE20_9GAMM|nr:hypothetical protein [Acinetobacter defluvii]AWL29216.1 hypothetical protein DJ533_11885 [Acinetobacter defluvii]